jgi:putrescine transport system ATP-binding protein
VSVAKNREESTRIPPWQDVRAKPFVRVQNVTKVFGSTYAVDDVSVDIYQGEFFSLLGGSGCGNANVRSHFD